MKLTFVFVITNLKNNYQVHKCQQLFWGCKEKSHVQLLFTVFKGDLKPSLLRMTMKSYDYSDMTRRAPTTPVAL